MITQSRLKELLEYNPGTGSFKWRVNKGKVRAGSLAGTRHSKGHRQIKVDGKHYLAQRLAWLAMTGAFPDHLMTHDNQDRADNSWDNLLETARIYSPVAYKRARVAMLNTRIGKLAALKELAILDVQSLDPGWMPL